MIGIKISNIITPAILNAAQIDTAAVADDSISTPKVQDAAVTGTKIEDGAIGTTKLAAEAVVESTIGAAAVTAAKIADNTITDDKIQNGTILGSSIAAGTIGTSLMAAGAVTGAILGGASVSTAKLAAAAVTASKVAFGTGADQVSTDQVPEGSTNQYFTDQRAVDAIEAATTIDLPNITHSGAWSITCDNDITIETTTAGDFAWLKTDKTYVGTSSGFFLTNGNEIDTWGGETEVVFKKRVVAEDVIVVDNQTADPTGVTGSIYFNTTTNKFRGYNGTAWVDLG